MIIKKKKKDKGFALILVVVILAIMLGIFFNYSMTARARKGYLQIVKASSDLENSVSQALSVGVYDAYIIDQMIAKNQDAVQDYMGYFIVKDTTGNSGTKTQLEAEKIWQTGIGNQNQGQWYKITKQNTGGTYVPKYNGYMDGIWSFADSPANNTQRISKGGFFIKSIRNMEEPANKDSDSANDKYIYIADEEGNCTLGCGIDPIQKELKNFYWDQGITTAYPKFEVIMYKNILLEAGGKAVRSYDAIATLELNYKPVDSAPTGTESKYPYPMKDKFKNPTNAVIVPGVNNEVSKTVDYIAKNTTETQTTNINSGIVYQTPTVTLLANNTNTCTVVNGTDIPGGSGTSVTYRPSATGYEYNDDLTTVTVTSVDDPATGLTTITRVEETPEVRITTTTYSDKYTKTSIVCKPTGNSGKYDKIQEVYKGEKTTKIDERTETRQVKRTTVVTETSDTRYKASRIISYDINHIGP